MNKKTKEHLKRKLVSLEEIRKRKGVNSIFPILINTILELEERITILEENK